MKILIVDDQKLLLDVLVATLSKEPDFVIAGAITETHMADVACGIFTPDIVLMDICTQNGATGLQAAEKIKKLYPKIKIILMTGFEELSFIDRAQQVKADSFIYKSSSMEEFVDCINKTMEGKHCYPESDSVITFGISHERLTEQEIKILRLFCQSKSRREMAELLGLSASTVNFHINNMLTKTGYKKLMGLAMEAANKGYIRIESEK